MKNWLFGFVTALAVVSVLLLGFVLFCPEWKKMTDAKVIIDCPTNHSLFSPNERPTTDSPIGVN